MSFQFRFQALLMLRRRQRDQAGAAVGQASEAIHRVDTQIEAIRAEQISLRENADASRTGVVSVDNLLSKGRYNMQLQVEVDSLQQTRSQLVQERSRRQSRLVDAEAELKRFEKLEQNDRAAHIAQSLRREQAEADDDAGRRYSLKRQRQSPS